MLVSIVFKFKFENDKRTQLAVYTTYMPLIVLAFWGLICYRSHLFFFGNQKQPLRNWIVVGYEVRNIIGNEAWQGNLTSPSKGKFCSKLLSHQSLHQGFFAEWLWDAFTTVPMWTATGAWDLQLEELFPTPFCEVVDSGEGHPFLLNINH